MSNEEKITLENYNYNIKGPNLNSPLSIKSLQLLGIEEKELKILSFDEYINLNRDYKEIAPELQKEIYDNYFHKHEELITKAKEKRKQLISESQKEDNTDKISENKIYHCELHRTSLSSISYGQKGNPNPNCEKCNEYTRKYEKMKERVKLNIQLEIDHEYEKKEKMKKQMDKHKKFEIQEEKMKYNKMKDIQNKKEKEIILGNERKREKRDKKKIHIM